MPKKRTIRYQSSWRVLGWPLVSIACGPDESTGEKCGVARGVIAIGNIAVGLIAIGGISGGGLTVGGVCAGLLGLGGVSLGGLVLAGVAIGYGAFGGVAIGKYAWGGAAIGRYVICPKKSDPEAVKFFNRLIPGRGKPESQHSTAIHD